MEQQGIVVGTISRAWDTFKSNIGRSYVLLVASILLGVLIAFPIQRFLEPGAFQFGLQQLLSVLVVPFTLALTYSFLLISRGEEESIGSSLELTLSKAVPLILGTLVVTIFTWIGLVFFVIPGIIVALGFSQTQLLIIDQGLDWKEAMRSSWRMMTGFKFPMFLLGLAAIGIILVSMIPLFLGLLVSAPLMSYLYPIFYDRVLAENASVDAESL